MRDLKLFSISIACVAGLSPVTTNAEEIIVSATRTPRLAAQTGSAVSVITAEDIEARQYNFVADALRDTPGVFHCAQFVPRRRCQRAHSRGRQRANFGGH